MDVSISNQIYIKNPTDDLLKEVEENLSIVNPTYLKNERLGYSNYKVPYKLNMYKLMGDTLVLPFGCLEDYVFKRWKEYEIKGIYIKDFPKFTCTLKLDLYDYQREAVDAIEKKRNGIVVAPCGAGKTNIGLAFIAEKRERALWITHTADLLNQSKKRAESILDFGDTEKPLGTITEGKIDCGNCITFATIQTLVNLNLDSLKDYFSIIIVDECHHAFQSINATAMFSNVMNKLTARYKIGLTATPYRTDKLEIGMFALIGNIIHEVPPKVVEDKTVRFVDYLREVEYFPKDDCFNTDGTLNYTALITDVCTDDERNNIIAEDIKKAEGSCLVLSERISQLEQLQKKLSGGKQSEIIKSANTKKAKQERNSAIERLEKGNIEVLFATYQLAREGLDVPSLRNLFFASPIDTKAVVIQATGRVQRKAEGKDHGNIYDYIDSFSYLRKKARNRINIRKKLLGKDYISYLLN